MQEFINELVRIGQFLLTAFGKSWPLLAITIPLSVVINHFAGRAKLEKAFRRHPLPAILLGTMLGAISPLCSCSVIPAIFALLKAGIPLGPVMAFWIASPSMDPEIFFLSVTTLGWDLAFWRLASTTLLSFGGGWLTHLLDKQGFFGSNYLRPIPTLERFNLWRWLKNRRSQAPQQTPAVFDLSKMMADPQALAAAAMPPANAPAEPTKGHHPLDWKKIRSELLASALFVLKFMLLAYTLEALIVFYVPTEWVQSILGNNGVLGILTATALGLPLYTTNLAALGIIGGLVGKGMSASAALAFLISGPTTTLPAMSAVFGITRGRVFAVYFGLALGGALLFGFIHLLMA